MRARDKRKPAGYTLIEIMVVVIVMTAVLGSVVAVIVAARKRVRSARLAAEGRFDAVRASGLLARDIRAARSATAGGGLVLVHGESRTVVWLVRGGRLARAADGRERVFRPAVSAMRVSVADGFVEVGVKLSRGGTLYVAARTRLGGSAR